MGLFYFMAIEKRFYNLEADYLSFLTCFHTIDNKIRIHIEDENKQMIQFLDLDSEDLKQLINDLKFILKEINDSNELY